MKLIMGVGGEGGRVEGRFGLRFGAGRAGLVAATLHSGRKSPATPPPGSPKHRQPRHTWKSLPLLDQNYEVVTAFVRPWY